MARTRGKMAGKKKDGREKGKDVGIRIGGGKRGKKVVKEGKFWEERKNG